MISYSLDSIQGYEAEKKKIIEIADSFKRYQEYKGKGIPVPKGLLLSGEPGTGKTLFARVLSAITDARFYVFSPNIKPGKASNLALKEMYEEAKNNQPAIIFIDEIHNYLPSYQYRSNSNDNFLSTILSAMDGDGYEGVMLIGATTEKDNLPDALTRSGRMDEHIVFSLPDRADRERIFKFYLNKVKLEKDVDTKIVSYKTRGFSGADLRTLVEMAARKVYSLKKEKIVTEDFFEPIYNISFKDIKRSNSEEDIQNIAIHEIGHLLVGKVLLNRSADVSIDKCGYIDGVTTLVDSEDDDDDDYHISSEFELFHLGTIATSLGGMAAEIIHFGSSSVGCISDINKVHQIIKSLFNAGVFGFEYLNYGYADNDEISNKLRKKLERKQKNIFNSCLKKAKNVILNNYDLYKELVNELIDRTVLVSELSNQIFDKYYEE